MDDAADMLMLSGLTAGCTDCGDERVFVPVEDGAFCCTTCDAAVYLVTLVDPSARGLTRRVA